MLMASLIVALSGAFTACDDDDDDYDTNQISGGVSLSAASLQVTRGAYMTFKGNNLDQITEIIFPDNVSVTDIEVVDSYTIRCIVPDEAVEGTVTLVYSGGTLTTGVIAFTEDIEFNDFEPKSAEPGDVITLEGLYLNYFTHARFATGEAVELNSVARREATVTVPVDASTGKFYLVYYTTTDDEEVATEYPSPEDITIAEPVVAISDTALKTGDDLVLTGSLLRIIDAVVFTTADDECSVSTDIEDPTTDIDSVVVTVPDSAISGTVSILLLSGLQIEVGTITLTEPTVSIVDTESTYGVGDVVTITGTDLDLIATATFAVTDGVDATTVSVTFNDDGDIELTVLAEAITGDITLIMPNGNTYTASGFVTTKPTVTLPDDATPLDSLTLEATLATRIVSFDFNGETADAYSTDDSSVSVKIPLEAETGTVSITMDNGEVVEIGELTINDFTFCAITEYDTEVSYGSLFTATVVNGDYLTDVQLNGTSVNFWVNEGTLYVATGSNYGDETLTLISSDGTELTYEFTIVAETTIAETTIWSGSWDAGSWSGLQDLAWGGYDWSTVSAGTILTIYFTQDTNYTWWQVRFGNGSWSALPGTDDVIELEEGATSYSITLTQEMIDELVDNGGLVMTGCYYILTQITLGIETVGAAEDNSITVWEGSYTINSWNAMSDLSWGGYDWTVVSTGDVITLYFTEQDTETYWQMRVGNGSWDALPGTGGDINFEEGDSSYSFTLTDDDIDQLVNYGGMVVTGHGYVLTKITYE